MSANANEKANGQKRPLVEWVFGIVSGALVGVLILFLGYQAVFGDSRPADLVITVERTVPSDAGTLVLITVANIGDEAASEVTVQALRQDVPGDAPKEIRFDYVAGNAVRRGAFVFPGQVSPEDVHLEIGGYSEPQIIPDLQL